MKEENISSDGVKSIDPQTTMLLKQRFKRRIFDWLSEHNLEYHPNDMSAKLSHHDAMY